MPLKALKEVAYPEYRGRHLFTVKFRLAIFILFWVLYAFFMKDWMEETRHVAVIISACFFVTAICHYNLFRQKLVIPSMVAEVVADSISMTAIVYLTGGPQSTYFTVYIFYAITAGMLYNHRVAAFVGLVSALVYGIFTLLCRADIIPPLLVAMDGMVSPAVNSEFFHPLLLLLFLVFAVYTTKIAHHFTQVRERLLEARNKELTALHKMSNTVRSMTKLEVILEQVMLGVMQGLDFKLALLMLFDKRSNVIRCYPPLSNPIVTRLEEMIRFPLAKVELPADVLENSAFRSIRQNQIIFRKDISDLIVGVRPEIHAQTVSKLQAEFGLRKAVAVPLVAEGIVIGALLGFSTQNYFNERTVDTLESFANQAAMAIQTAQLIAELRKKNAELQEASRVKGEFLATMTHELRTPLTAIIGFSELMMEGIMGELNSEQKDSVREVLNNGSTLLEMINNLLDLAKIDSGKMKLNLSMFDLGELLEGTSHTISSLIKRKKHHFELRIADEMPPLEADQRRIQQAVLNLLSNAIKFTPEGGKIVLDAYNLGEDFFVSVSDSGIGIKQEDLAKIFDVFSQADSSLTRSYEGTGLGLALAKQFIELHGGKLSVESEYGKGTVFRFTIPACQAKIGGHEE